MKFLFIMFLLFGIIECIKVNNFCYQSSIETNKNCNKRHSFKCSQITNLCSIDRYSCQSLTLFSKVKHTQRKENDYIFFQNQYEAFIKLIKVCPKPPKYKLNPNDVCLNTKNCLQTTFWRIWSTLLKLDECNCKGKYNFKCNSDYCASDKRTCDYLKEIKNLEIKKC